MTRQEILDHIQLIRIEIDQKLDPLTTFDVAMLDIVDRLSALISVITKKMPIGSI